MEAFKRDTRVKLAHNPTGEVIKVLTPYIMKLKKNIAVRLARVCAAGFALFTLSCTPEPFLPSTCESGDCNAQIEFYRQEDENGYYHIELDWTGEYLPYFYVDIYADKTSEYYKYNDMSVVTARFDSDTSWIIGDTLVVQQAYYSPFGNTTQQGVPLPAGYNDVNLPQYIGTEVNVAQNTAIYFNDKPEGFTTRRYLGPFIPQMIGDTITVYMKVNWDAGDQSQIKSHYLEKFIIE